MPAEITCADLVRIVTEYLEGTLTSQEQLLVEQHLVICSGCSDYLQQMRHTIALTGALREEDISPEAEAALLQAFRGWQRT